MAANNLYYNQLASAVKKSNLNIQLKTNVTQMSELMAWADISISAGGTSTWELTFMGLPMIMIAIAENQRHIVEELGRAEIVVNLGWHQDVTPSMIAMAVSKLVEHFDIRADMSRRVQVLVDGKGVKRVLAQIRNHDHLCRKNPK